MKLLQFLLSLALFAGLWSACKDADSIDLGKTTNVAFVGRIMDENNQPLPGAVVQAGDQSAITDLNGVFRLPATRLATDNARLSVHKTGYFEFSRAYIVEDGAMQTVTIQLLAKTQVGSVAAMQGGLVQVPGGPTLTFPANGVMTASGGSYNGTVLVYAHFINPEAPNLALHMPGDLRGINAGGEEQVLATFGMIAVEISGMGGEALQIAAGSEVEIAMPIASSQSAAAPASISLWYFDLEKARWIEEGSAQKINNQYVGKVKHFSFWNYDTNYPSILLHGKVFANDDQHPLNNVQVWVGPADLALGWGYGHGTTDANGNFGGAVPQGILLRIEVFINEPGVCDTQSIYSQTIGPFTSDVILPGIIVSATQLQFVTLTGRLLDCNQQPITNGYAKIQLDNGGSLSSFPASDGTFQANFTYCTSSNISGQVTAYDLTNYLESLPQGFTASSGTNSIGDLPVCNTLTEFFQYTLDGQSITLPEPYSHTSGNGQAYQTFIIATDSSQSSSEISMIFNNNQQPGTFPITRLYVHYLLADSLQMVVNTTISSFGNPGEPIIGTFGGTFPALHGISHTISGSYRVIRQ